MEAGLSGEREIMDRSDFGHPSRSLARLVTDRSTEPPILAPQLHG